MPPLSPLAWSICILAAIVIGVAKGGFTGLGMMATPLVALVLPPAVAAAIILPVLIVQDAISTWAFRHDWDRWIVAWMLPGGIIGVALGYVFAANVDELALKALVGAVTLAFGAYRLWIERGNRIVAPSNSPGWVGTLFGVAAGFTSQVSHAGAPPYQTWVTPRKLPHLRYAGTTAILFTILNWVKVPAYVALGVMSSQVLRIAAVLIPVAIVSTLLTIRLLRQMHPERFYKAIYVLMIVLGTKLLADGIGI